MSVGSRINPSWQNCPWLKTSILLDALFIQKIKESVVWQSSIVCLTRDRFFDIVVSREPSVLIFPSKCYFMSVAPPKLLIVPCFTSKSVLAPMTNWIDTLVLEKTTHSHNFGNGKQAPNFK